MCMYELLYKYVDIFCSIVLVEKSAFRCIGGLIFVRKNGLEYKENWKQLEIIACELSMTFYIAKLFLHAVIRSGL